MEEVSSGEGDAHFVEFCPRDAHLLYHRVLERMGGLADEIRISWCATGTSLFDTVTKRTTVSVNAIETTLCNIDQLTACTVIKSSSHSQTQTIDCVSTCMRVCLSAYHSPCSLSISGGCSSDKRSLLSKSYCISTARL